MPVPVTIPRLGWSMDEGTFVGWLKGDGAEVRAGEPLFELEGEKALQQIESLDNGILRVASECPAPGSVVAVGTLLGYLLAPGEVLSASAASPPSLDRTGAVTTTAAGIVGVQQPALSSAEFDDVEVVGESSRRILASPRARRVARQQGVDLGALRGSGRGGRIRERDVLAAAESGNSVHSVTSGSQVETSAGTLIPHTPHRRTIAQRMQAGCNVAAPVTLTCRVDATNLVNLREQFQAACSTDERPPSYTDILVKLTAAALVRHPRITASWTEEGLLIRKAIHVGIAVDTEAGLVVPVIRDVGQLSLRDVAVRSRELINRARARRLTANDQSDGTFTITNLGMYGVDAFTPIVNLPQAAILGVGRIVREPVVRGEQIVPGHTVTLSLTIDHRVLDGAEAARFLADLTKGIENPAAWLVGM